MNKHYAVIAAVGIALLVGGCKDQPTPTPTPTTVVTTPPVRTTPPTKPTTSPTPTASPTPSSSEPPIISRTKKATPKHTTDIGTEPTSGCSPGCVKATKPKPKPTKTKHTTPAPAGPKSYYANCTAVRKDYPNGFSSSNPAYRAGLDRDHDNWACETSS